VLAPENDRIAAVARERIAGHNHAFYIGRGVNYPVALEGALKLKEISYLHAEGYHAAEMKHGPIALLSPEGMPVVALLNRVPGWEKSAGNAHECKARKAPLVGVITDAATTNPAPCATPPSRCRRRPRMLRRRPRRRSPCSYSPTTSPASAAAPSTSPATSPRASPSSDRGS
jgi:fructoselysine-6-P-deglycase FrlB-like protein